LLRPRDGRAPQAGRARDEPVDPRAHLPHRREADPRTGPARPSLPPDRHARHEELRPRSRARPSRHLGPQPREGLVLRSRGDPLKSDFLTLLKLEWSFTISTVLLVVVLIGTTMCIVHSRLQSTLHRELELRGRSIARSIGAVATPSLLGYNYAALQLAAEGASVDADVLYVAIHDKEGTLAGAAGRERAPRLSPLPLPS